MKPLLNNIIVKEVEKPKSTTAGILLTESEEREFEVVAAGPGEWRNGSFISLQIKAGARLLIKRQSGDDFSRDGKKLKLVSPDDIIAVL